MSRSYTSSMEARRPLLVPPPSSFEVDIFDDNNSRDLVCGTPQIPIQHSGMLKMSFKSKASLRKTRDYFVRDTHLRLAADQYRAHRRIQMAQAARKSSIAEEDGALKQLQEYNVLLQIVEQGHDCNKLNPVMVLRLARATRNTLVLEEKIAILKLREYEGLICSLRDAVEEAHARVVEADYQVGSLLNHLDEHGIYVDEDPSAFACLPPIPRDPCDSIFSDYPLPSSDIEASDDSDSGSYVLDAEDEGEA